MSYLFCLRSMNRILDMAHTASATSVSIARAFGNWFTGYNKQWFFIAGRSIPVPANYFTQFVQGRPVNVTWVFNHEFETLSSMPCSSSSSRLRCLSISVTTETDRETNMEEDLLDSLISNVTLYFHDSLPPPTILAAVWSVQNSRWHSPDDNPILHIIDRSGEAHAFPMFGEYNEEEWERALGIHVPHPIEMEEEIPDEAEEDADGEADGDAEEDADGEADGEAEGDAEEEKAEGGEKAVDDAMIQAMADVLTGVMADAEKELEGDFVPVVSPP